MSMGGSTFVGFGIRIDILSQAALFAFQQLTIKAAALAVAISSVVNEFLQFEKAMADVERMMSVTIGSMDGVYAATGAVREQILQMSSDSIYSVQQLAESYSFLLRAGLSVEQSMQELWRTEQLALATGMQLNEAAETRIRLIKMWGAELTRTIGLNDQLVKVEQLYTMTTEQLTDAMNHSGAIARLAGLSFAQTAVIIGELVAAGITASTAGTTLRSVLYKLLAPTNAVREAISGLNLNVDYILTLPIAERMSTVAEAILNAGVNTEQASVALETFGIRGSNIAAILDVLSNNWDNQALSILEASGSAELAAQIFRENLTTRLSELNNQLTVGMIRLGAWITQSGNAMTVATLLALGYFALANAKRTETRTTIGQVMAQKMKSIADATGLSLIWGHITAIYHQALGLIFLKRKNVEYTTTQHGSNMATFAGIASKGAAAVMTIIYASTLGVLWGALKMATQAARGLMTALGPIGIVLMIVGAALAYVMKNTDLMTVLMDTLNPLLEDFADIWYFLQELLGMVMKVLAPILKMIAMILLPVLKILLIPLRIVMGVIKMLLPILMVITSVLAGFGDMLSAASGPAKVLAWVMKGVGVAIEWVGKVINIVVDWIIGLINAIIKFFNLWGANIELLKTTAEMAEEREKEKEAKDLDEVERQAVEDELQFSDEMPVDDQEPGDQPEVTDDSGLGGTGHGTGDGTYNIQIYITTTLSDMMDVDAFAEKVAEYAMQEAKRVRGAGIG